MPLAELLKRIMSRVTLSPSSSFPPDTCDAHASTVSGAEVCLRNAVVERISPSFAQYLTLSVLHSTTPFHESLVASHMAVRLTELNSCGVRCQTTGAQHRGEVVDTVVCETLSGDEDGLTTAVATGPTATAHAVQSDMSAAHPHKPEDQTRDAVTVRDEGRFSTTQTLGPRDAVTALDERETVAHRSRRGHA